MIVERFWQKVRVSCDNPPCCNPKHLRLGTQKDNKQDQIDRHRIKIPYVHFSVPVSRRPLGDRNGMRKHPESVLRGELSPNTRLTESNVLRLRKRRKKGVTLIELSKRYGIGISQVQRICKGQSWNHLNTREDV